MEKCYIVETAKVAQNIRTLQTRISQRKLYAVLKADGYGLGCRKMAVLCGQAGVRRFAVSDLRGAEEVFASGATVDELLLLSSPDPAQIGRLAELGVTFTVASEADAALLAPYSVPVHVKIDTGMGRRGLPSNAPHAVTALYRQYPTLSFTGIYTHFSTGADLRQTQRQFSRFQTVLQALDTAGIQPGTRHCCSSSSLFHEEEMLLDGVRAGSALLGRVPGGERFGLHRTGYCQAEVERVRQLPKGWTVGYGGSFRTQQETLAALCPIGTHHGFGLSAQHGRQSLPHRCGELLTYARSQVLEGAVPYGVIHGHPCKVLGRICSETVLLDVTHVPCKAGDPVLFDINPLLLHHVPVRFI